jgi:hypothetical protein
VVGHQAIRPNLDAARASPLGHEFEIFRVIVRAKESLLTPVPPLRNVMRHPRHDNPRHPRHTPRSFIKSLTILKN